MQEVKRRSRFQCPPILQKDNTNFVATTTPPQLESKKRTKMAVVRLSSLAIVVIELSVDAVVKFGPPLLGGFVAEHNEPPCGTLMSSWVVSSQRD